MLCRNPASIFIAEFSNFRRQYFALYRHWPQHPQLPPPLPPYCPILFKYAIAVVLSESFQDLQYLFKAKKTAFSSKKLIWLCSFVPHLSPIGKHPSVAPQPNSLATVYNVKSILGRWMCLQALGMCWSHQCNSWTAKELSVPSFELKFPWWSLIL